MSEKYDSTNDTIEHIKKVSKFIDFIIDELIKRAINHDQSKLVEPEKSAFDKYTPLLKNVEYGSNEYKSYLKNMKDAIDHHYKLNRHHPEHFEDGIKGMNLIDLVEMMADWYASSKRMKDGDPIKSVEKNQDRFKYDNTLKSIFNNTMKFFMKREKEKDRDQYE